MEELLKNQQSIKLSGASASHQNGTAERTIKTVVNITRTEMMHAALICIRNTLSIDFSNGNVLCCMDL